MERPRREEPPHGRAQTSRETATTKETRRCTTGFSDLRVGPADRSRTAATYAPSKPQPKAERDAPHEEKSEAKSSPRCWIQRRRRLQATNTGARRESKATPPCHRAWPLVASPPSRDEEQLKSGNHHRSDEDEMEEITELWERERPSPATSEKHHSRRGKERSRSTVSQERFERFSPPRVDLTRARFFISNL